MNTYPNSNGMLSSLLALSNKADYGFIMVDDELVIVDISKKAESILDLHSSKIGTYLPDLVSAINREKLIEILKDHNKSVTVEIFSHYVMDRKLNFEWMFSPLIEDGKVTGTTILVKNITEKLEQKKNLESSQSMVRNIFGYAPIGIYQVDHSGKFVAANPELAWMLGYESSGDLVRRIRDVASQMFYDTEEAEEFFFTLFEAEEVNRFRAKLKRSDGSPLWTLSYAKASKNESGRIEGFFGFSIDITNTVRTEERLKTLNEELKYISMVDGLTQISNRRKFDEYIYQEWKRMGRERKGTISMILCDIDYFKLYNDNYGHQQGDYCLQKVALAIKECVKRPADLVARYGGEEFVILLPDTELDGAKHIAERVREAVKNLKVVHKASDINEYVTLSLGVGTITDLTMTPDDLIKISDKALYRAKDEGRDRVC
jgi:diguanylate cyclase (GGDEF)-like protein/PAS domain S-box-containing protein